MDEEILLKRRLIDTANKAYRQNIYTYTNFLSMSELDTYYRTLPGTILYPLGSLWRQCFL